MIAILKWFGVGLLVAVMTAATLRALLWLAGAAPGEAAALAIPTLACLARGLAFLAAADQT